MHLVIDAKVNDWLRFMLQRGAEGDNTEDAQLHSGQD